MPNLKPHAVRRLLAAFAKGSDGVVAIEMAIVGLPFLLTLIGIFVVCLMLYCEASLDYAVRKSSRQVMIGATQNSSLTAAQFNTQTLCPLLPAVFDCSKLVVVLKTLPVTAQNYNWNNYHQFIAWDNSAVLLPTQSLFCPGAANDYEVMEVAYPFPVLLSLFATSSHVVNGKFMMLSSTAFRNEPFSGAAPQYSGC